MSLWREVRFFSYVDLKGPNECWVWLGALDEHLRGKFYWDKNDKNMKASRASCLLSGLDLLDLFVLHKCDNPSCVNPNHLFLGTQKDNMIDLSQKRRHHQQKKVHCPYGHEYSSDNLVKTKQGRICKACKNKKAKVWREKNKDYYINYYKENKQKLMEYHSNYYKKQKELSCQE